MRRTRPREIVIDYDAECSRCGRPGAMASGICIRCVGRALHIKIGRSEKHWICQCGDTTAVPRGERCPKCGKTEREKA